MRKSHNRQHLLLSALIAAVMTLMFSVSVFGAAETGRETDQELMPGVWESTVYVTDANNNNVRAHILRISHNSNVALKASNADHYTAGSTKATRKTGTGWGYITVEKMIQNYESIADREGSVIAGVNGDFYDKDAAGRTIGKLIVEGNVMNSSSQEPFFAVMEDGTCKMMDAASDTTGVAEAIAGKQFILRNGQILGGTQGEGEALLSLGITANGGVVLLMVDGRESSSAGTTYYDMAHILQKQGCVDALQLDGGGSATFMTRRSGDSKCRLRSVPNDGLARPVSSALLVVKKDAAGTTPDSPDYRASDMREGSTSLKKLAGTWRYTANGKKMSGFRIINNEQYLFKNGKGLTKTITLGNTKYYYKKGKLTKCSDKKAGRVAIGFCGAGKDGQNLLYAYNYGNHKLNIGLNPLVKKNGKMEKWTNVMYVPWMSEIRFIKSVNIGKGVKNIGGYFACISREPFNDDAISLGSELKSVTIADTVTSIGKNAFYNNQKLRKVTIPAKVSSVKTRAFAFTEKATYTFKGKKPPKFGGNVFESEGSKMVIKAKSTAKWKKLLNSKSSKKKLGFKGKVKYTK